MAFARNVLVLILTTLLVSGFSQDTIRYRSTSFHGSINSFHLVNPMHPQLPGFFPAAILSVKSSRTDSTYRTFKKLNFTILLGVAASRYSFFDEKYFINIIDKSPYHVLSKHFWGGFGINYRTGIRGRWTYDVDVVPCIQINVDRSEDSRTDTSGWISLDFYNIYQGLHLNVNNKIEYALPGNFSPFISLSCSVPLTHTLTRHSGDDSYYNTFNAQLFAGIGVSYFYRSRRIEQSQRTGGKP